MSFTDDIRQRALEEGFDVVGVAPVVPARHGDALRRWVQEGHHADMDWIARNTDRRMDPSVWQPDARAMVVVGVSYATQEPSPRIWNDPMRGRIARYAWGRDYHKVIGKKLKRLAAWVAENGPGDPRAVPFNDAKPVMEHDAALAAGLGFIGRNSLLIHPEFGSMLFLGGLLVSCELEPDTPTPGEGNHLAMADGREAGCGACTRCLGACPTHAFPAEYILDSRLCISYQTIENRGEIPERLRPKLGNWIFGCDVCQEVCPWVKRYSRPSKEPWLIPEPGRMAPRLDELARLSDETFLERFAGTPIMRTKRRGLLRNVAIALGNSGVEEARESLERLRSDSEPLISDHAVWGLKRLEETRGG